MKIIDSEEKLEHLVQILLQEKYIALDTEFIRENTYYPILCLIQIATKNEIYFIDTIKVSNLESLRKIIFRTSITKIFHSARQDLEILFYLFKAIPTEIFDTQIAAAFCGFALEISYDNLVKQLFSVEIDKKLRTSNWKIRPLSQAQIAYAANDVFYLLKIYEVLNAQLNIEDKNKFFKQEILQNYPENLFADNTSQAWKKIRTLNKNKFLIKEISSWREEKAKYYNKPRNHFLSEKSINKILEKIPLSTTEFLKLGIDDKISNDEIKELIQLLKNSLKNDQEIEDDIAIKVIDLKFNLKYQSLEKLLKEIADKLNICQDFIISYNDLKKLIHNKLENNHKIFSNWRYQVFTQKAQDIITQLNDQQGDVSSFG